MNEIPLAGAKGFLDGRVSIQHSAYPILVGRGGERPSSERLTDNDFSSVTVARDGSIWTAWAGFRDGADRVYAERIAPGSSAGSDRRPHEVSPEGGDVFRTAMGEDSEGKVWVVWSERVNDNWDLYARSFDGQSWSRIQRLTRASQPDTQHNMARDSQGGLHLVWQGYRNNRAGIFHKSYKRRQRLVARDADQLRPMRRTAGNPRSRSTAKTVCTPHGISMGPRVTTSGCARAPAGIGARPSASPSPSASKPT